jgi:hypothetical protein
MDLFLLFQFSRFCTQISGYRSQNSPQTPLDEGAQAGNGLAENQVLHLERALVGVESFRIHEESPDVVVSGDAVAAE